MHCISTCRRPIGQKLGKVVTYCDRLPPLQSYDLLIAWPTCGHLTTRKKFYLLVTKLFRVVTSGSRFRMQMPKSSTPCCCIRVITVKNVKMICKKLLSWVVREPEPG